MSPRKSLRVTLATALSAAVAFAPTYASAQVEPPDASPTMRINNGGGSQSATLVLPFGKSAIIDLPADARDILISNPAIADATVRTARRAYVIGRQLGQTNIFFFDANGRQIANVEIRVEPDVAPLNDILNRHSSESQIRAEAVNGSIVLSGSARSAADADRARLIATQYLATTGAGGGSGSAPAEQRIVNLIQVQGSEQVMVRVRVVEMSRTLVRQLGINANYDEMINQLLEADDFLNIATANGFSINGQVLGGLTASGGVAENILRPNSLAYPSGNVGSFPTSAAGVGGYQEAADGTITYGAAHVESSRATDASIEAFERAGLLRVLAEPNLTAISGESARFLAGGEFPVPVNSEDGQISVEFKPFGVGLAFTPIVMSGGNISLKINTEVSELTTEGAISTGDTPIRNDDGTTTVIRGINIPALQVRRAETTLEMSSGSSIVLAGLIQERTRHALEGVPGVMNTPILGSLFRSRDFVNSETELVIIVTPYLVRPTSPDRLRTPADGFRNPSEGESLLTGRLNAMYRPASAEGDADEQQAQTLHGPHGHVIE
jgi:pilus assembly protein CpaC